MKKRLVFLIFAGAFLLANVAFCQTSSFNIPQTDDGGNLIFEMLEVDEKIFALSTKAVLIYDISNPGSIAFIKKLPL